MCVVRGCDRLAMLFACRVDVVDGVCLVLFENDFEDVVGVITRSGGLSLMDLLFSGPYADIGHDTFAPGAIPDLNS